MVVAGGGVGRGAFVLWEETLAVSGQTHAWVAKEDKKEET